MGIQEGSESWPLGSQSSGCAEVPLQCVLSPKENAELYCGGRSWGICELICECRGGWLLHPRSQGTCQLHLRVDNRRLQEATASGQEQSWQAHGGCYRYQQTHCICGHCQKKGRLKCGCCLEISESCSVRSPSTLPPLPGQPSSQCFAMLPRTVKGSICNLDSCLKTKSTRK